MDRTLDAGATEIAGAGIRVAAPAEFAFEPLTAPPARPTARQAAEHVADAVADAERIREEARRDGFAEGLAAGMEQARAELEPAARALAQALQEAMTQGDQLASALEREAVELAMVVAEKVVAGAVAERPERVLDVVTGALRGLVERRRLTILVHPEDAELVREGIGRVTAELGGVEHCDVQAERRVARGGALLRTPDGELDVRLDAKLRRAAEVLREVPA
ncbi:FliH/SctL family protein [Patulibacter minatonensis]|uniref:FliH/SctL family protein n=1 Tax=Patulibacter minatonensis TaxID=298163 RepID=UPI00047A61D9|nr:FliH/SctL family protein [Patulibacter minatonensis]